MSNNPAESQKGTDVRSLIDAVGNAGVDIEAEHEAILQSNDILQSRYANSIRQQRAHTQDFLNNSILRDKIRAAAAPHQLQRVDEDCLQFLALATQARLRHLVELMIQANYHRCTSSHIVEPTTLPNGTPLYSQEVRTDVDKQIQALEKIEREQETKARRQRVERITQEREQMHLLQSQQQQQQFLEEDDQKKKKRKKDLSTAKNMSDDVQKKLSDQTALRSAGLAPKYSWLTGTSASSTPKGSSNLPKPKFQPQQSNLSIKSSQQKTLGPPPHDAHLGHGNININDALFALEREKGMGAGRGSGQMTAWKKYITAVKDTD